MVDIKSLVPWRERFQAPATREASDPFVAFRREVDRMFDSFFGGFGRELGPGWAGIRPAIDLAETDKDVVLTAELPGVSEKDLDLSVSGNTLTIRGEKKEERDQKNGDISYVERRYGSFARTVQLPFEPGDEKIEAKFDKGVLTVRVPKPADVQKAVRRIEVKAA